MILRIKLQSGIMNWSNLAVIGSKAIVYGASIYVSSPSNPVATVASLAAFASYGIFETIRASSCKQLYKDNTNCLKKAVIILGSHALTGAMALLPTASITAMIAITKKNFT